MAPTLRDSSADLSSSDSPRLPSKGSQPVALEVPVAVNGARAIAGSDKREPFSENTTTVLVFSTGAVIRLTSTVQPGQLLFLTNEKTRKEVVCQVVKSKSDRNSGGYVELQFTEPVSGFWGMRFPNEHSAPGALSDVARPSDLPPKPLSASQPPEKVPAPVPIVKPEIAGQFKTEIKPEDRHLSKADFLAPSESSAQAPKLDSSPLQEQLAALLAMDSSSDQSASPSEVTPLNPTEVAAQILNIADTPFVPPTVSATLEAAPLEEEPSPTLAQTSPAPPPPPKSTFQDEEVKIPAWLQPLARNESVPAPASTPEGGLTPGQDTSPLKTEAIAPVKRHEPVRRPVSSAAVFGNSLLGETRPVPPRSSSGGGKGIWVGAIAALLVLGATGAWIFRDTLFAKQQIGETLTTLPAPVSTPAPASDSATSTSSPVVDSTSLDASPQPSKSSPGSNVTDSPSTSGAQPRLQAAAISERIPKTPSTEIAKTPAKEKEEDHIVVVEPEKRPSLGNVRLKKPKVGHSSESDLKPDPEPAIDDTQSPIPGAALNSGFVGDNTKGPAAPDERIKVGGDVRVARMISSTPPVYPALAKAQHISGDVRIDALIDAAGRVTTMKVVSGPSLLHQAAMDALRNWKYQPATLDGKPVAMHLTVTIQFRLQ